MLGPGRDMLFMGTLAIRNTDLRYQKSLKCVIRPPNDPVNLVLRILLLQAQSKPCPSPGCGDDPEHEIRPAAQGPQLLKP